MRKEIAERKVDTLTCIRKDPWVKMCKDCEIKSEESKAVPEMVEEVIIPILPPMPQMRMPPMPTPPMPPGPILFGSGPILSTGEEPLFFAQDW